MPDAVFRPGGRGLIELDFDRDPLSPHDDEGVFDIGIEIKVERHLVGMVRRGERLDPLHRKHPHVLAPMAIGNQVEPTVNIPQPVRIHFAAGGRMASCREIPHLHRMVMSDRLGEPIDRLAMVAVRLVRAQPDGKPLVQPLEILCGPRRDGCGDLRERGIERGRNERPLEWRQQLPAEGQGHQFRRGQAEARNILEAVEQAPPHLPVHPVGEEGEVRGFEGGQIPTDCARMPGEVRRNRVHKLSQREPATCPAQPLQQVPLAHDLIVAWHGPSSARFDLQ